MQVGMLYSACECMCVNGHVEAVCQKSYEVRPVCTPRVCPITPPSIAPIESPQLPPLGTTSCHQAQVYNEYTRQYEWQRICQ
ncbi:hypothetical protein LS81_001955 [Helicobacter trogontum]|uniref:Uncharacterized protein n=2 Tax=Helicobacter trogontum TaxID=50960 RepID=A0A4U8SE03_9HELI|nr:hypothetical protein LS81_001955 [Helicobacter trogontum]